MIISDEKMAKLMSKALKLGGDLYTLDDIDKQLLTGDMQGHVEGNTWAITQVHDWPHRKSVNILYVVGNLDDSIKLETRIENWAKGIGASLLTGIGREGWWEYRLPGWKKVGTLYSKDI
jgi:hypothetical protein